MPSPRRQTFPSSSAAWPERVRAGWKPAISTRPTSLSAILKGAVSVPGQSRDIRILPGLAQRAKEAPDVMRGEETQLLGAIAADAKGEQLVCMPGTHSKWVRVVERPSHRLFDLHDRRTLRRDHQASASFRHAVAGAADMSADSAAFGSAIKAAFNKPALATNLLFTARAGQLLHGLTAAGAQALISGTLIGAEIAGALSSPDKGAAIYSRRLRTPADALRRCIPHLGPRPIRPSTPMTPSAAAFPLRQRRSGRMTKEKADDDPHPLPSHEAPAHRHSARRQARRDG